MQDLINDFPKIVCDRNKPISISNQDRGQCYAPLSNIEFDKVRSCFGIALHMHQPMIFDDPENLRNANLISNLQYMMEHRNEGDNHNAPIFMRCYSRISDFIRELSLSGHTPRIMLDYSGNLLWGLSRMEKGRVIENLKLVTTDKRYYSNVEWLGTMWSHAVVTSTPVPDIRLHIEAWQCHFASIFGKEALARVRGFSPPEMHLPIHPDVCFAYVKALKERGYRWLLCQEHTIENLDASGIKRPHFPHRLIAKNSLGEIEEITVLIKTQGSDTKLVAQMQPYYEALTMRQEEYAKKNIPPFVAQISDGENGGVMMNEFPPKYLEVMKEIGRSGTTAMNGSEYLEFLSAKGVKEEDFIPVQPVSQHKIWEFVRDYSPGASDRAIDKAHQKYNGFNLDKASWTNDKNWVKGYENVLDPINKLSVAFHRRFDNNKNDASSACYKRALVYLLLSQTSCFRYWGEGVWTEYAKEICRRCTEFIEKA